MANRLSYIIEPGQIWEVNEYKPRGMSDYGPVYPLGSGDKFVIVSTDPRGFYATICKTGQKYQFIEQSRIKMYCRLL